jgi:hypothetical protein
LTESHAFVVRQKKLLLQQSAARWRGMWILPPLKARSPSSRPIHMSIFPFTNHHVTLKVFARRAHQIDKQTQAWFSVGELDSIPIPSPHHRAISDLLH